MMKHCKYCGKEIHEFSSFCPYCMQSQIEKQNVVSQKRKSKKWLYFSAVGIILIAFIVIVMILLNDNHQESATSDIPTEITGITTTTLSTTTSTTIQTTQLTTTTVTTSIKTSTTTVTNSETTEMITTTTEVSSNDTTYHVGDYITEGKSTSQIQGYGGYENIGGTILEIEEFDDNFITFSIIKYSESGYASDTVSARNITAEIVGNTAEFEFNDMLDGKGMGILTFENGKIHIVTYPDETTSTQTSIIVDEWLS